MSSLSEAVTSRPGRGPAILPLAAQAIYLLVVGGALYALRSHWAYDDPYITYRYARNLAQGLGFVYNPAERVLSTTTPLFTLLLAAIVPLWSDIPRAALLIGTISLAAGGLCLWKLGGLWENLPIRWIGLAVYPTFPLLLSTLGSETPLYLALCLAAFVAYAKQRYPACAIFTALAVLTRPDGLLLGVVFASDFLWRTRRPLPWKAIFLFVALSLPWFIFAWMYFGSPLPATLAAKQHQASMEISQGFIPGFLTVAQWYTGLWYIWLEALLALIGAIGVIVAWRIARHWLLLLAWTLFYFLAYGVLGVSRYFWYYAPLVPGILAACGLGLTVLERLGSKLFAGRRLLGPLTMPLLSGVICAALAAGQAYYLWEGRQFQDSRAEVYRAAGEWLQGNTPPDASIGAFEVGIIGYFAQRPMIDFAGLIQPAIAVQLKPGNTYLEAALWAIDSYHPHYLIMDPGAFQEIERRFANQGNALGSLCNPAKKFEGNLYHSPTDLVIYNCTNPQ